MAIYEVTFQKEHKIWRDEVMEYTFTFCAKSDVIAGRLGTIMAHLMNKRYRKQPRNIQVIRLVHLVENRNNFTIQKWPVPTDGRMLPKPLIQQAMRILFRFDIERKRYVTSTAWEEFIEYHPEVRTGDSNGYQRKGRV